MLDDNGLWKIWFGIRAPNPLWQDSLLFDNTHVYKRFNALGSDSPFIVYFTYVLECLRLRWQDSP